MRMYMIERVKEIAIQAGNMMLEGFQQIHEKTDIENIVTNKDIEVQEYIISELKRILPEATFLAEESTSYQENDGYQWVIDPIDGTTNFAYDYHHSVVSIGLLKDHEVVLGVCYNPYLDEMFHALKGKGSYVNDKRLQVNHHNLTSSLVLCGTTPYVKEKAEVTFENMKTLFLKARDIRRGGSAVLDICYIAAGRGDVFIEELLSPWDYAAASLILQEANGVMHIFNGTWGFQGMLGMIAGNSKVVEEVRVLLNK